MLTKKYIFETRKTRAKRYSYNGLLVLGSFCLVYLILCGYSIYVARVETNNANEAYYKKAPDLVAIFTGDIGRIPFGIHKALEYQNARIFISGVYTSNSIMGLLRSQYPELLEQVDQHPNLIEIDYQARNTVENVISTLRYLRSEKNLRKVLIVSSDYHIMRIKFILDQVMSPNDQELYQFNFIGIENDYHHWRSIKRLFKEVFKSIKTYGFLLLWDVDSPHQTLPLGLAPAIDYSLPEPELDPEATPFPLPTSAPHSK